jgi:hypothetical protein
VYWFLLYSIGNTNQCYRTGIGGDLWGSTEVWNLSPRKKLGCRREGVLELPPSQRCSHDTRFDPSLYSGGMIAITFWC